MCREGAGQVKVQNVRKQNNNNYYTCSVQELDCCVYLPLRSDDVMNPLTVQVTPTQSQLAHNTPHTHTCLHTPHIHAHTHNIPHTHTHIHTTPHTQKLLTPHTLTHVYTHTHTHTYTHQKSSLVSTGGRRCSLN